MASLLIPQQLIPPTGTTLAGIRFAEGVDSVGTWSVTGATATLAVDIALLDTPGSATAIATNTGQASYINASLCPLLVTLDCSSAGLISLDVSGSSALTTLNCESNNLTALDVSGCTSLTTLDASANGISSLDVSGLTTLTNIDLASNSLDSDFVDDVLAALVANGAINGTAVLTGNAIPSAAGLANKALLEADGWTVSVDS